MAVFTAVLFTVSKRWKRNKYPLTDEWINHAWSIQMKDYYSSIRRDEVLIRAMTQMSLGNMLGETNQRRLGGRGWGGMFLMGSVVLFAAMRRFCTYVVLTVA